MIAVDFHSHSLFSGCGVHTVVEMLTEARRLGLAGLAITDHGRLVGGRANSVFFERLEDPVPGIRLLKGIEANPDGDTGKTDVPRQFLPYMDLVLLGLHDNQPAGQSREYYTQALVAAMEQNPFVDVITHPNSPYFPVDYDEVCSAATRLDVAVELNNSKVRLQRVADTETEVLIESCLRHRCRAVLSSDAHCFQEIGRDEDIRPLLRKHGFPEERIVNSDAESAFGFIESRRERKKR